MTDFTISRNFPAQRTAVFDAWMSLDQLAAWWGPKGFAWLGGTLDARPGGRFLYRMRSPDGWEFDGKFTFHEIVAPERLVFTNGFADAAGNSIRAPFSATFPIEVHNTVTFAEVGGQTEMTLRGIPFEATAAEHAAFAAMHDSLRQGFGGTFEQLAEHLGPPA